jgi:antitoxin component YwqK of YwqJK toxin-antitoxin module
MNREQKETKYDQECTYFVTNGLPFTYTGSYISTKSRIKHGFWTSYYDEKSKKIMYEIEYDRGKCIDCKHWDENGKLIEEEGLELYKKIKDSDFIWYETRRMSKELNPKVWKYPECPRKCSIPRMSLKPSKIVETEWEEVKEEIKVDTE